MAEIGQGKQESRVKCKYTRMYMCLCVEYGNKLIRAEEFVAHNAPLRVSHRATLVMI